MRVLILLALLLPGWTAAEDEPRSDNQDLLELLEAIDRQPAASREHYRNGMLMAFRSAVFAFEFGDTFRDEANRTMMRCASLYDLTVDEVDAGFRDWLQDNPDYRNLALFQGISQFAVFQCVAILYPT